MHYMRPVLLVVHAPGCAHHDAYGGESSAALQASIPAYALSSLKDSAAGRTSGIFLV